MGGQVKLFRPMMLLGSFVIALGVFSWLLVPSWRQSPVGALVLLATFGLGGYAIVSDMKTLWEELRKQQEAQENTEQDDTDVSANNVSAIDGGAIDGGANDGGDNNDGDNYGDFS